MHPEPDLSAIAALIGDSTRASMLSALLGGQSLPASELAHRAHITAQTASAHLAKLVDGGLLQVRHSGRHRYYGLKNADVAHALEALAMIAPPSAAPKRNESEAYRDLCFARTCYDHLAGKLGVTITQTLLQQGLLTQEGNNYHLTQQGADWLTMRGIEAAELHKGRRHFARTCLDWSERQDHLAGALGAALATWLFEHQWLKRVPGTRAVRLTETGRTGLQQEWHVEIERL